MSVQALALLPYLAAICQNHRLSRKGCAREVHMRLRRSMLHFSAHVCTRPRHRWRIQSQMCRRKERSADTIEETIGDHQVYARTRVCARPISPYIIKSWHILPAFSPSRPRRVLSSSFVLAYRATHGNSTHTHARVRRELLRRRVSIRQIARVETPSRPVKGRTDDGRHV